MQVMVERGEHFSSLEMIPCKEGQFAKVLLGL